ncbi:hypothetical protein Salat_2670700 [Sesamum alatum]|uniref:Uncharacterized protein n=1 Tax=Sesamum alatum TaxID=300844 RepID=A0AAE1XQH6_9LAMI|nr:hypothetical protein Salat_2670700 [Sesamum alatum]
MARHSVEAHHRSARETAAAASIRNRRRRRSDSGDSGGATRSGNEAKVIDEAKKKLRENTIQKFARWMYDAGIPFKAINYESFGPTIEAIGQYDSVMKPPSYYEVKRREKECKVIDEAKKKLRKNAIKKFAKWMYDVGIPFNVVNFDRFGPTIDAIGQYGSGMKPPSY